MMSITIIMVKVKTQMKKINHQKAAKVKRKLKKRMKRKKEEKINKNANNNEFKLFERIDNN